MNADGSIIAKQGFKNEKDVVFKFNNWKEDNESQTWLKILFHNFDKIKNVESNVVKGNYKTDIQVHITTNDYKIITYNLQIKLISNSKGYNQIDKRWIDTYTQLWNIPEDVSLLLKYFTGEIKPYKEDIRDKNQRRMFLDEFNKEDQSKILSFFKDNKKLILSDIFKGRGEYSPEWILVTQKTKTTDWILLPMEEVINYYQQGSIKVSPRGSIKFGRITVQRKGGDKGKESANMLQFKLDPSELFNIK